MSNVYRSGTSRIGWVEGNGDVYRDPGGTSRIGWVDENGDIYGKGTSRIGKISDNGDVYGKGTDKLGQVDSKGNVYGTQSTDRIGWVDDASGLIDKGGAALLLLL